MKKKKLLYILHNVQLGGAEVALISAIPALNEKFDLRILALGTVSQHIIQHLSPQEQKVIHSLPFKFYTLPILIFRALFFSLRFNPDIIISSFWRASLIGAIAKKLRRKIYFISFIHSSGFAHRIDESLSGLAILSADKILADSNATRQFINNKFHPAAPIGVVSFLTNSSPPEPLRLALDEHCIRFLFLGRINRVKNLSKTIEVIGYLRSENINAVLDIYGKEDGDEQQVNAQIEFLNLGKYVTFRGEYYASDKKHLFKDYHFLIQLSHREGMAMSVAEAMQHGLPCVVTPVGEIKNYASDMETAVFVNTSGSTEWNSSLAKIKAIIQDKALYEKIRMGGYAKFREIETYQDSLIRELQS